MVPTKIFSPQSTAQTDVVWPRDKRRGTCKDSSTWNRERKKKERTTKEEMGRQHRRMDRTEAERGDYTCGRQREIERTGS